MRRTRSRKRAQAGFTMIEVMIAVLLTAIAVIGIVGLYRVQTRSAGYSRFSTEASVLAADKMEQLRTIAITAAGTGSETGLDARGQVAAGGIFDRSWVIAAAGTQWKLEVTVQWDDDGQTRTVVLHSLRNP
jgi:prepilin-type N-terminal cleavage/methylation domain-containing protein